MPSFFEELTNFGKTVLSWLYLFLGISIFFFSFGLKRIEFRGYDLFFPFPSLDSLTNQFLREIQQRALPEGTTLIVTNPLAAFLAQIEVALFLGFMASLPLLLYKILDFIIPALYPRERRAIFGVLFPSLALFFGGSLFAYFFLIPRTFGTLYSYLAPTGAMPFFAFHDFVAMSLLFVAGVGVIFLLPVFMALLTYLGIVEKEFWKENWRYAFLFLLFFSAIITPDGSGITMVMLSAPLLGFYFCGYLAAKKLSRSKQTQADNKNI